MILLAAILCTIGAHASPAIIPAQGDTAPLPDEPSHQQSKATAAALQASGATNVYANLQAIVDGVVRDQSSYPTTTIDFDGTTCAQ